MKGKESPLCVIADDSVFLPVAVARVSKASHIISLFPGLGHKGFQYLQAVSDENGYSMERVQVINKRKQLTMNDTHQNKVAFCFFTFLKCASIELINSLILTLVSILFSLQTVIYAPSDLFCNA